MRSIFESAAYDPDRLPAPKNLWFDDKGLAEWYEERRKIKREPETN